MNSAHGHVVDCFVFQGRLTFRGVDIEPSHAEQELYRDVILLNCRNLASVREEDFPQKLLVYPPALGSTVCRISLGASSSCDRVSDPCFQGWNWGFVGEE